MAARRLNIWVSVWVALLLASVLPHAAVAEELYGLAMVGAPKYTDAGQHLTYVNPDAPMGGTLKQAAIGTFDTLNPYNIKGKAAQGLDLVTDRLMGRVWDEPFTLYPLIAEKIEVAKDRSWIIYHLNPKARFHDGTAITADDVLFTFETLKKAGRPNMQRIYKLVTLAEKLDPRSVKFSFGPGYDRETVMILSLMPVLSKAIWQGKTFDATTLTPFLSSGPYKIAAIEPGRRVVLERIKDYWAADLLPNKGLYNFDRIIYDYYRDDSVALESFKNGELNLRREWDAGHWAMSYNFPAMASGKVVKEALPHNRPDRVRGFIFNTRRAPFNDIRVREALNLVFDFEWINQNLYHGLYQRINSYWPNTELAATDTPAPPVNQTPEQVRENLRRADALLQQAGWIIKDGNRINAKTSAPFAFEIMLDDPANQKITLAFARSLKRLGITPTVRVLDSAAYLGRLNQYDFDMTLYYWNATLSPGSEQYLYWSCDAANAPSRWNYAGVCDKNIDRLAKSIATATSHEDMVDKVHALDSALMAGQYMIPLYYNPADFVASWVPLKHPQTMPIYGTVLESWWMDRAASSP